MDPVTIVQLVGTAVTLSDAVFKCIKRLHSLKAKYHDAPLVISTITGQLYMVQAALEQLKVWNRPEYERHPRYLQLAMQMDNFLECFSHVIFALANRLEDFQSDSSRTITVKQKLMFLWGEQETAEYSVLLDRQVNALNLLLQAVQCNTWAQQQHMIDSQESQFILQQATDISSSIIGIEDQASFISEDTTGISIMFDFDAVILSSRAYQQARKSHLRQAIRANHHFHSDQTNKDIIPEITVPLRLEDSIASSSDNGSTELLISQPVRDDPIISKAPCSPTEKEQGEEHVQNTKSSALLGHKRSRTLSSPISPNAARLSAQARRLSVRDLFWKTLRQKSDMDIKEVSEGQSARVRSRKVLILGSSESGKSTLFKGLKLALHEGYTTEERLCFNETIWSSILQSARVILGVMESLRIPLGDKRNACHVATILSHSQEFVAPSNDFCQAISALWRDSGFHGAYERRQLYQLHDNACYYARVVHRVLAPDYLPTDKDILSSSTTTTGITMACFPEQRSTVGIGYDFYDVGGARSERRKWVQSSANVSTVLFTIDTTSYARALREDEEDTRMQDQLWLFEGIANNRWFSRSTYILVFTKMDLLRDWLSREPPERYLPDYNYHLSHEGHYMKYLENKFLSLFRSDEVRSRVEILRANLVDVDGENAAKKIVQMLNVQTARYPAMMGCSSISD